MTLLKGPSPIARPASVVASLGGRVQPKAPTPKAPAKKSSSAGSGLPTMPSVQSIRAQANQQAWKSIQAQIDALPDTRALDLRYQGMRNAITPLVDAHKDWLLKAGEYSVGVSNQLAQIAAQEAGAADTVASGAAAAAGAPVGSTPPTNVTPGGVSTPVAAYGGSFANYLRSLLPYATAQGIGNIQRLNDAQQQDLDSINQSRDKILATLPDTQASYFKDAYNTAFNDYKSELSALAAGDKTSLDASKFQETIRHNKANEDIAQQRATAALQGAMSKATSSGKSTASEANQLKSSLAQAYKIYQQKGGRKVPAEWGVTLVKKASKNLAGQATGPDDQVSFRGSTPQEVQDRVKRFLARPGNQPVADGPHKGEKWVQQGVIAAVKNSPDVVVGQKGEANRRAAAWAYLKAQNSASLHPLTTENLKALFRNTINYHPAS